jgi:NAD+ synthase
MEFSKNVLQLDPEATVKEIAGKIVDQVGHQLKRKGAVVAISGGIDSSVTAALCVKALGPKRVLGLFLPEKDSADESLELGQILARHLGIEAITENIRPVLEAAGCYRRRDEAVRMQLPEFDENWKCKLVFSNRLEEDGFNFFYLVVQSPSGEQQRIRLNLDAYMGVVAATNMKQRTRKFFEYYHADRLNFAVSGTPNRLEYDQGFFVKGGDGLADFKPIAHLYKSQVYQLADYFELPDQIRRRPPTTDTYSLPQTQEEFYFPLPYQQMDLGVYAKDHVISPTEAAPVIGISAEKVERLYKDIDRKRQFAQYLHAPAQVVDPSLKRFFQL